MVVEHIAAGKVHVYAYIYYNIIIADDSYSPIVQLLQYLSAARMNPLKNSSTWEKEGSGHGPRLVEGWTKRSFSLIM